MALAAASREQARPICIRLEKGIQQLQQWHAVFGDIGQVADDPDLLAVANNEQDDWVLPWFICCNNQSVVLEQTLDLQHRI